MPSTLLQTQEATLRQASEPARGGLRRHGRATLLWAVASFILLQLGLRVGIDSCWRVLRDPTFEIKARRLERLISQSPQPPITVLMFGSSVTGNSFKAAALEERLGKELGRTAAVFNMANLGAGPMTELIWMRRLLDRGIRPHLVLIEFSPHLYLDEGVPVDAKHFPPFMLTADDLEMVCRYAPDPDLRDKWRTCQWIPSYGHRLTIVNYLSSVMVPVLDQIPTWGGAIDERFWSPLGSRSPEQLRVSLAILKEKLAVRLREFTAGKSSCRALDELLGLLQKAGIPACVIMVPEGPTLRSLYNVEKLQELEQRVVALTRKHGDTFVRAFDWLDEEMFADSIHPTIAGADLFSNRICRDVVLPTLAPFEATSRSE
jgi:hypothetical protein